jgi:hypothetical protein
VVGGTYMEWRNLQSYPHTTRVSFQQKYNVSIIKSRVVFLASKANMNAWNNTLSKQYRENNTHELYGKYGAYVKPCRSIRKSLQKSLGEFKMVPWWYVSCTLLLCRLRKGARNEVKRLIMLKCDRQALVVHAVYKSGMTTQLWQSLERVKSA